MISDKASAQDDVVLMGNSNRRDVVFSGDLKKSIFSRELLPMGLPSGWETPSITENYDEYNTYTLNNYGYRGPDIVRDVDIITAGCSQTFGTGVPDNGTWPEHVSRITGSSYVNLSAPGASIEWVIETIHRYIDNFGKPKKGIMVLFPDIFRVDLVIDQKVNSTLEVTENDFIPQYYSDDHKIKLMTYSPTGIKSPNLIKRPFPVEYTWTFEQSIKANVMKIRNFERYCEAAGIELLWSSWSDTTVWLYGWLADEYRSEHYIDLKGLADWKSQVVDLEITEKDPYGIADRKLGHHKDTAYIYGCNEEDAAAGNCRCYLDCHFDMEDEFIESFHLGTDWKKVGKDQAHYGVHRLMHIAEDFVSQAKDWFRLEQ